MGSAQPDRDAKGDNSDILSYAPYTSFKLIKMSIFIVFFYPTALKWCILLTRIY